MSGLLINFCEIYKKYEEQCFETSADVGEESLTQAAEIFSELPKHAAQSFGVGVDFWCIHHKDHAVNLVFKAWFLYEAHGVRSDRLFCTELWEMKRI